MCAGTVVEPPGPTSAEIVSVTSRSRSVALKASLDRSALISTLARIGIVLRRSTTRWTWPSDFNSAARSTVTFMPTPPVREPERFKGNQGGARRGIWQGWAASESPLIQRHRTGASGARMYAATACRAARDLVVDPEPASPGVRSLLQLPLEQLDFLGEPGVAVDQIFDLAHRMQHGGVVTAAEAAADLRQ